MAFQVSPGVQVQEIDLTNVVPAVSTSIGGYAGAFSWGPVEEIRTIGSEKELASVFGVPSKTDIPVAQSFLTAASFLKYATALKVIRAVETTAKNATSGNLGNSGVQIKNRDQYDSSFADEESAVGSWGAKYPGTLGNSLKVSVCPHSATSGATSFSTWAYVDQFTAQPGVDEFHIVIVDEDGLWTGTPGTVLEKFEFVSTVSDALKEDGSTNYYKNVLNNNSKYVWYLKADSALIGSSADDAVVNYSLTGGTDVTVVASSINTALELFADAETVDVNLLFAGADADGATDIAAKLCEIANTRKDLLVFLSPPLEASVGTSTPADDVKAWAADAQETTYGNSSYAVYDSTALKIYDKYSDTYRWIPACGHVAGLCANTDQVADAWFSPAGLNRGQLLGVTKLAYNAKQADRDALYKASVNPIVSFPGQGTILFGDKTGLTKPSAFDRINVRRLFITLEKAISTAAKFQLFEFNDEFTRAMFRNMVEPFLRDVQGRRGLTDFLVVCDTTNNTAEVVDRNEFRAEIYIKPARSINYITLSFIATRSGVQFSELVGK
jgi:phage tail sheath protein FI